MGKSNKFDYSNRGSSGKRLGEIIGSALKKESEKVKKDAERHAQKTRKQSSSSSSEPQETTGTTHYLDLRAPLKELGDDGVAALADGLEEALRSGTATASLALEMLTLSGNGLTVSSLARLAPVIHLARFDLKVLDFANNALKVETDEESVQWETFLCAFRGCRKIEHLNLSHNQGIGPRALEVFARVYLKDQYAKFSLTSDHPAESAQEDDGDSTEEEITTKEIKRSDSPHASKTSSVKSSEHYGLRSIPYIGIADISLHEFEALWLSYIITEHLYPVRLISDTQERSNEEGIDCSAHALGKDGLNLLRRAEEQRSAWLNDPDGSNLDVSSLVPLLEKTNFADPGSAKFNKRKAATKAPFTGTKSSRTGGGNENDHSELASLRRKFQRQLIESAPPVGKSELWGAALELFITSRKIFCLAPPKVHKTMKIPPKVIQRIADFAMEGRRLDFMTKRQREVAIARGLNRQSLMEEREWARKGASTQVWMLLDQIECLAYEEEEEESS